MKELRVPSTRFEVTKEALLERINTGIAELFAGDMDEKHQKYLEREMELLNTAPEHWVTYLVMTADLVKCVRKEALNGISAGRGIICSSLIANLLKITSVDPLEYNLSLDRLYSGVKIMPIPSIDFDMSAKARTAAVDYLKREYGQSNVWAPVVIVKGRNIYDEEKLARHACAYIVSDKPLESYTTPVTLNRDNKDDVPLGLMTTLETEEAGLIRFNFIHNKFMDSLEEMAKASGVDTKDIPSPLTMKQSELRKILSNKNLTPISCLAVLKAMLPCFNDSMDNFILGTSLVTFHEPRLLWRVELFAEKITAYKRLPLLGEVPRSDYEFLEDILSPTYGEFAYQEQITAAFARIFGTTEIAADEVRKDIGKKKMDKIRMHFAAFTDSLTKRGMNPDMIIELWNKIFSQTDLTIGKSHAVALSITHFWYAYYMSITKEQ